MGVQIPNGIFWGVTLMGGLMSLIKKPKTRYTLNITIKYMKVF